jgi:NADH-quinone oxidoreductase subunit C
MNSESPNGEMIEASVKAAFPEAVESTIDFRGEKTLVIKQEFLRDVCTHLRDDVKLKFDFLEDIVADDLLPEYPRFAVNYHISSTKFRHQIRLRVPVEDPDDGPDTLTPVWPVASWLEIEVWDLMGITFKGNDKLRRLFLPEDWQGHPLRKDYPLGYEEVQFSFNWEAIDAKKPYAKD